MDGFQILAFVGLIVSVTAFVLSLILLEKGDQYSPQTRIKMATFVVMILFLILNDALYLPDMGKEIGRLIR